MIFYRGDRFRHMLGFVTALVVASVGIMPACVCALNAAPAQSQTALPCHEAAPVSAPARCPTDGAPCEEACDPAPRTWAANDAWVSHTFVRTQTHAQHANHLLAARVVPARVTDPTATVGRSPGERDGPAHTLRDLSAVILRV